LFKSNLDQIIFGGVDISVLAIF